MFVWKMVNVNFDGGGVWEKGVVGGVKECLVFGLGFGFD